MERVSNGAGGNLRDIRRYHAYSSVGRDRREEKEGDEKGRGGGGEIVIKTVP